MNPLNAFDEPESKASPADDVAGAMFQDFQQRSLRAEVSNRSAHAEREANDRDSLASLFRRRDFARSTTQFSDPSLPAAALPHVGDELFGFRLQRELGHGAFARVFLAAETELADRPVVLKVSDLTGSEPQTLAQLQHTHIVPIFSVHEDQAAGIRAVCMPYFGGASLSEVLKSTRRSTPRPTRGADLAAALAACDTKGVRTHFSDRSPEKMDLPPFSFPQACAWIIARLAEGLQHAHERHVLHRDIKPSNILLASDGTPLLLDFNLSHDDNQSPSRVEAILGGTVAYMAPEHLRALSGRRPEQVRQVDERSDVYSLGMVLFEMITGHNPFEQQASYSATPILVAAMAAERSRFVPSLRQLCPNAAWGLESIVRKCLQPDPAQRYQQAADLADDLERWLNDRALRFAPELSREEQLRKWVRRHPRLAVASVITAAAAIVLTAGGLLLQHTQARLASSQARALAAEGAEIQHLKQEFQRGTLKALCLVNTHSDLQDHAAEGRGVCEQTLGLFNILGDSQWQQRPAWQRLSADEQRDLAQDARELLLLLAGARVRESQLTSEIANAESQISKFKFQSSDSKSHVSTLPSESSVLKSEILNSEISNSKCQISDPQESLLKAALALLDKADAITGLAPSAAIWHARANYWKQLSEPDRAAAAEQHAHSIQPATARDFHLLATARLQDDRSSTDRHAAAIELLQQAVRLDSRHYWSWMQKGLCHLERGEPHQALADFGVCVGLWPEFAWGCFNRGFTLDQLGHKRDAIGDYSAAIERDSELSAAFQNRGMARLELREFADALSDFDRLQEFAQQGHTVSASATLLHALRGQALEGLRRHAEADAAFAAAFSEIESLPEPLRHRVLCAYGFAVCQRLPEEAARAFAQIPSRDPKSAEALYGLALIAVNEHREERAVELFHAALAARPTFEEARRFRAVILARLGRFTEAVGDINTALQAAPRSGPTLYAAACVTALAAEQAPSALAASQAADEAITFLRRAIDQGFGRDQAAADSDLAGLRSHPEFQRLIP